MTSLQDISTLLRATAQSQSMTQAELRALAGISQRTLTNVLSGDQDFKVSTLLALADRLGLKLLLVPRQAAVAVEAGAVTQPRVKSRVSAAKERVRLHER